MANVVERWRVLFHGMTVGVCWIRFELELETY
jgi:hypothetical protein